MRFRPDVLTGVSAGAINAAFLATRTEPSVDSTRALVELWGGLRTSMVVRDDAAHVTANAARWGVRLLLGRSRLITPNALLDTSPLRRLLADSLGNTSVGGRSPPQGGRGWSVDAWAVTATNYCTGRAETFVERHSGAAPTWERPYRRGLATRITVDHVLASCAISLLFPPVRIGDDW